MSKAGLSVVLAEAVVCNLDVIQGAVLHNATVAVTHRGELIALRMCICLTAGSTLEKGHAPNHHVVSEGSKDAYFTAFGPKDHTTKALGLLYFEP